MPDVHTLRIGGEYVVLDRLYLNAGYAFKSPFRKNYLYPISPNSVRIDTDFENVKYAQSACFGIGYRGRYFMAQAAYQYQHQKELVYAFETAEPYSVNNKTHHLVITIGFHL